MKPCKDGRENDTWIKHYMNVDQIDQKRINTRV